MAEGRIYVSGPMHGRPHWNWPAFERAAKGLRAEGWDVVSPAEIDEELGLVTVIRHGFPGRPRDIIASVELNETFDFREAIARDLELVDGCDAIYLLNGWENSLGAQIELDRAHRLGLAVFVEGGAEIPAFLKPEHLDVAFATDRDEEPRYGPRPFDPPPLSHVAEDMTNPKDLLGLKKPPLHLVPPAALSYVARVMGLGAEKYGAYNWREKAVRETVYLSAAMRHLAQALDGEDEDPESGMPHEAHVAACMAILLDAKASGNLIDDRPTPGPAARVIQELTVS